MSFQFKFSALLAITVAVLAAAGCKKEPFSERTGFVVWTGEYIDGGCGWLLSFPPDLQYQPRNLPDTYKVDSLPVTVIYRDLKNRPDCANLTDIDGQVYVHKVESPL